MTKTGRTLRGWMRLAWDIGGLTFWAITAVLLLSLLWLTKGGSLDWEQDW